MLFIFLLTKTTLFLFIKYSCNPFIALIAVSYTHLPLARKLFPNAKIVLDRFHIIQHLGRAFLKTRIAIMNQFDKKSLPYRALKNHWRLFQKDSRKLSLNSFYSKTFRQTLVPHEIIEKTLVFSEELANAYKLYQLLLFHFQAVSYTHLTPLAW